MNIDIPRLVQVGAGAAGIYAGYRIGSAVISSTRHEDLTGPPTREVGRDGQWILEQENTPLTDKLTKGLLGVSAAAAGLGAFLVLGHNPTMVAGSLARSIAGALLIAGAAGLSGGSIAAADRTSNTTTRPSHAPTTDGIAITTP